VFGITSQRLHWHRGKNRDGQARRLSKAREDITVAPVVTSTTDDDDAMRSRETHSQEAQSGFARPLHEGVARNAELLDGMCIERAHLRSGVQGGRESHRLIILRRHGGPDEL
jgi:hypothetical protein